MSMAANDVNTIITGDCLEVMDTLLAASVQLICTSPPYPGQRGDKRGVPEWLAWFDSVVAGIARVLTTDGVLALNLMFKRDGGWYDGRLFTSVIPIAQSHGLGLVDIYAWDKMNAPPTFRLDRCDIPMWEPVFVFAKSLGHQFNPVYGEYSEKTLGKLKPGNKTRSTGVNGGYASGHSRANPNGARQGNVLHISSSGDQGRPRANGQSFPRGLPERFILQYTQPGDVVADIFAGVGTTLRVAQQYGRQWIGIEIDPHEAERARVWLGQQVTTSKEREALPLLAWRETAV